MTFYWFVPCLCSEEESGAAWLLLSSVWAMLHVARCQGSCLFVNIPPDILKFALTVFLLPLSHLRQGGRNSLDLYFRNKSES